MKAENFDERIVLSDLSFIRRAESGTGARPAPESSVQSPSDQRAPRPATSDRSQSLQNEARGRGSCVKIAPKQSLSV